MFGTPSFNLNVATQESESKSRSALYHDITSARRLQKFHRKWREINKANNPSERDDISWAPSTTLPALFNETHSLEVRGQLEALLPQPLLGSEED